MVKIHGSCSQILPYFKVTFEGENLADSFGCSFDKDGAKDLSLKDMDQSRKGVPASWPNYPQHLTQLDGKVSRYNADLTGEDCHLFAW